MAHKKHNVLEEGYFFSKICCMFNTYEVDSCFKVEFYDIHHHNVEHVLYEHLAEYFILGKHLFNSENSEIMKKRETL